MTQHSMRGTWHKWRQARCVRWEAWRARPGKELRTAKVSPHTEGNKLRILAMVEIVLRAALL